MKKTLPLILALLCGAFSCRAQVWTDAAGLPLFGKAAQRTYTLYGRLPASLKEESRPRVWSLGQQSAGLYIRFRTASPTLWVRWESATSHVMNHMSPTGSRGLDLYVRSEGGWHFLAAAKPDLKAALTERKIISNMAPVEREYMLYLSLYDGVSSLSVGVEDGYEVLPGAVPSPRADRPVVMYGTSITQGGCVSRPGMVYTSIMSRALDREFINLGFSGNALLDLEIARLMASVENPAAYVLAPLCNASVADVEARGEAFFRILRDAHPDVPVVFVQALRYAGEGIDQSLTDDREARRTAFKKLFDSLKKSGEKNIYFADPGAYFPDSEGSVDGTHLTDLGTVRFAQALLPVLKKALRKVR